MRAILYTRHEGGVSLCYPSPDIFQIMQSGGYWSDRPSGFIEKQILRQVNDGINPDHAKRFAHAVAFGGCSEAEAWEIIRDRDCARHGTNHELVNTSELPDRWFRDAWVRGHNGGPIRIDTKLAAGIQWKKIQHATAIENGHRASDIFGKPEIKLSKDKYRRLITMARDEEEIRVIWPEGVPVVA